MEDFLTLFGGAVFVAAYGTFWLALFRKAGYEPGDSVLMAIGMFIPFVNLGLAFYFARAEWPIQTALNLLRGQAGLATKGDATEALSLATRLEARGNAAGAIAKYEEIIRTFPGSEPARDAEASLRVLRAKLERR